MDNYNRICEKCHTGRYTETGFFDDMDGVLHCDVCGVEVVRHPNYSDKEKIEIAREEIAKLIPIGGAFSDWAKDLLAKLE